MSRSIYDIVKIIGVFCAYFVAAKFGLLMPYVGSHITLIWLPTGIAIAALIRFGLLPIPSIFAAAFLVNLSISSDILLSAAIAVGNTLAPLSAYVFLNKTTFDNRLSHRKDTILLIVAAFSSMLISSSIGTATLAYFGILPNDKIIDGWLTWWVGDSVGVLLSAPLLLTLKTSELKNQKNYKPEKIIWFFTIVSTASVLFLSHFKADTILQFAFLFIPFIAWGSLRFSIQFSSFAVMVLAVIASYGASIGHGIFAVQEENSGLTLLWSFITATAIINLLINALTSEIKEAQKAEEIQNEKLTEQSRTLEEMNVELEAINEELTATNETITSQTIAIEAEKERYEIIMNYSSDGVLIIDLNGKLVECSKRACDMLGYTKEEIIGLSAYDWDTKNSKEQIAEIIRSITKQPIKFETIHKRKDGSFYDAEISACLIWMEERDFIYASVRDITEKKAIEQEREKLLELFDKGDSVLFRWNNDKNWSIKHVSKNVEELTGYTDEEFLSLRITYADIIHKDDIGRVISEVTTATTQNLDFFSHEPYRIVSKNGNTKWALDHTVLQKEGDTVTHYLGYISDITDLKNIEQQALKAEQKFHTLFEESLDGITLLDLQTQSFVEFNKRTLQMYGYTEEEFRQITPGDLDILHDKVQIVKTQQNIMTQGWDRFETKHKTKDGKVLDVLVSARKLDMDEKPMLYVSFHDITGIKVNEKKLAESEERLRFALEGAGDGIWDWNLQTNEVFFSKRWKEMIGFTENELASNLDEWKSRVHPEDIQKVYEDLAAHLEGKTDVYTNKHRLLCKDGTYKWMLDRGIIAQKDKEGTPIRLVGSHTDMTDYYLLQETVISERNFISTIINNANAIIAVIRPDGIMSLVNEYAENFTGYTKEEISSVPFFWSRFLTEEKRNKVVGIIEQAKAGNIIKSFQNGWISKDGEERMFEWSNALVKKQDGSMDYLFTIGIDISKQHEYSKKIKEESLLKTLALKTGDIGTWEWKFDSDTLVWDEVMYEIYDRKYENAESPYEMWSNAIDKADKQRAEENLFAAKNSNIEYNTFFWITTHDNQRKYIHAIGKNELDQNGIPTRMIGVNIDITKQKIYEEELEKKVEEETAKHLEKERLLIQQSRLAAMGEMISNIAHQWRQPLNQISALKDELIEDYYFDELDDNKVEFFKQKVGGSLQYMSTTIDDFRNFFKPDKEKTAFEIKDSITHTLSLLTDSLKSSNITVNTDINLDEAKAFGYPNEFSQALINILNNAKDALKSNITDVERRIILSANKSDESVTVSVQDNAGGIPKEIINKIFDPYFTTKHKSQGTGLGLYMSKMLIEQSFGGRLTVTNQNGGACFFIELKTDSTNGDADINE